LPNGSAIISIAFFCPHGLFLPALIFYTWGPYGAFTISPIDIKQLHYSGIKTNMAPFQGAAVFNLPFSGRLRQPATDMAPFQGAPGAVTFAFLPKRRDFQIWNHTSDI
jgi:hypothetical protein